MCIRRLIAICFWLMLVVGTFPFPRNSHADPPQVFHLDPLNGILAAGAPAMRVDSLDKLKVIGLQTGWDAELENRIFRPTPENMEDLFRAKSLEALYIEGELELSPQEILQLKRLPKLKYLNYSGMQSPSKKMAAICQLTQLESLDVSLCDLKNEDLRQIGNLKNLRMLDIRHTNVDSAVFQQDILPVKLERLLVRGKDSESITFEFLKNSKFPESLTHLYVDGEFQEMDQLPELKNLKHIRCLDENLLSPKLRRQLLIQHPKLRFSEWDDGFPPEEDIGERAG